MEDVWLAYAKRMQALALTGLHYCKDEYDRERYQEISDIALQMLADLAVVPLERITGLVSDHATGYVTPTVDVRGALIEQGKVLLVREKSDGLWTLPGGFADVGLSAGENVVKEIFEEASVKVTATHLYNVRHKAKGDYPPDVRDFYKMFFLCERSDKTSPTAGLETIDADFFNPESLPPLSKGRVSPHDIYAAFDFHASKTRVAHFD